MAGGRQCGCGLPTWQRRQRRWQRCRQTTTTTKSMPALVSQRPWNVNGIQNVAGGGTWTAARRRQEGTGCAVQTEPERTAKRAAPIDIASDASDAGNANKLAQAEAEEEESVSVSEMLLQMKVMHCDDSNGTSCPPLHPAQCGRVDFPARSALRRLQLGEREREGEKKKSSRGAGGADGDGGKNRQRQQQVSACLLLSQTNKQKRRKEKEKRAGETHHAQTCTNTHTHTKSTTRRDALQHFYIKFSFPI